MEKSTRRKFVEIELGVLRGKDGRRVARLALELEEGELARWEAAARYAPQPELEAFKAWAVHAFGLYQAAADMDADDAEGHGWSLADCERAAKGRNRVEA